MLLPSSATLKELLEGFEQRLNRVIAISADVLAPEPDAESPLPIGPAILGPTLAAPNGLDLDLHELDPVEEFALIAGLVVVLYQGLAAGPAALDPHPPSHAPRPCAAGG